MMESFSAKQRLSSLQLCEENEFDIVIVGGGITGAGAFLEASRKGLKVALFEQNDFASSTSSASSKLIHGGLRYLEMMDFGLVFESCRERKRLLKLAPDLVQPLQFTIPVYKGQRRNLWTVFAGTWIYSILSVFRNIGYPKKLSPQKTLELFPRLNRRDLKGCVQYFDASTLDSRLTLSTIKTGASLGGRAFNHVKVTQYLRKNNKVTGVTVEDKITKKTFSISAKCVVNTIGPWTDPSQLRLTKGVHIIVQGNPFEIKTAITMLSPSDQRVLFLIPWCGHTLIGTTDTDYSGSPSEVCADKDDLEYLLRIVQIYFPMVVLRREDVLSTFAGLRCLKREDNSHPSSISREHILYSNEPGLVSVAGGKLTTFISMGTEIIDWVLTQSFGIKPKSKIKIRKLEFVMPYSDFIEPTEDKFRELIRNEMVVTIRDLLQFRTLAYYLTKDHGASLIEMASHAIKAELGYSNDEIKRQVVEYKTEIEKQSV